MTRTFGDHDVALVDEQRAAGERRGWELVAVRETPRGALDVGIGASDFPEFRDLEDRGFGTDLKSPAHDEIRDRVDELDVEIGPGDTVAVIYYDLENWSYDVHYEQEHAGRVRVTVAVEVEQLLGSRDPQDVADTIYDKYAEDHEVAWTRAEVIDEASDHSDLEGFDGD